MEPFRIHILGCGSALPTMKHFASAQVVEIRGKFFMVDCGEGTQIQLRRSHVGFTKIQAIFISHLHGDHCLGIIGLISTFGMLGRTATLHIYAHEDLGPLLNDMLQMFCPHLDFSVEFHAINTTQQSVIFEDRSLTVETIPLQHRMPCCGFLFREKPTLRHIRRDMIDYYGIPNYQINNIKNGADWVTSDGETIANERLTSPADAPRSYAYCSDTRYISSLHSRLEGVNVLYHESTYDEASAERAKLYYHSTSTQAATVARDAHVGLLLLGHFSARYDNEQGILAEAKAVFPNSMLANEGLVVEV
ncbi:MAG: ribonuclease Z [Prevotella sp.]|nr:ribonuclease Z [Prevotella sp.]MDD3388581.1 ribonuclease Z [Prevotella sp.]MDD4533189.1 ribonuclease Z [Prevotella sp.]